MNVKQPKLCINLVVTDCTETTPHSVLNRNCPRNILNLPIVRNDKMAYIGFCGGVHTAQGQKPMEIPLGSVNILLVSVLFLEFLLFSC